MLSGAILLWFILAGMSLAFVIVDSQKNPDHPIMRLGWIILTAFLGVIGAFLYVLCDREPLPNTHEQYVAPHWKQVAGSTMHCAAGDGIGITAGAIIARLFEVQGMGEIGLEYLLGFGFGWPIFQAYAMRDMYQGDYLKALRKTFLPEFLSMNCLMAGMVPIMIVVIPLMPNGHNPIHPEFWFGMSMALLVGYITAYPMNWWMVAKGIKHGAMTMRPMKMPMSEHHHKEASLTMAELVGAIVISTAIFTFSCMISCGW